MGKHRGGRGGGSNGRFNQNNHSHNNRNGNNNNKSFNCNNCGPNNTHNTKHCFKNNKNGGPHNQNNKVNKKNNNNPNQNQNQNQGKQYVQCLRCGFYGHERKNCNAKELPEDQQCECGCEYHHHGKCPWNHDPLERQTAQEIATGKICQWCKGDGDGMHDFSECREPIKFKNQLMSTINRCYDDLYWCWHCSAENHKTKACDKPIAQHLRTKWTNKITDIIDQWEKEDMSSIERRYLEQDDDVPMLQAKALKAPVASDYAWCIFCQEFGHHADQSPDCDHTEYDRRCPARFKNSIQVTKQPYVPSNSSYISSTGTPRPQLSLTPVSANEITTKCINDPCKGIVKFARVPGKFFGTTICPICQYPNPHPLGPRRDSKIELMDTVFKHTSRLLEAVTGSKKRKKNLYDDEDTEGGNPYKKRPSVALTQELALHAWPQSQPRYTDLSSEQGTSPVFAPVHYYNEPGNAQDYFPAIKIKLRPEALAVRDNDQFSINRAGRMGLVTMCATCGTEGRVVDDEGDFVMCNSDGMCTVGCGLGIHVWTGSRGPHRCQCIEPFDQPDPRWVVPKMD